MRTTTVKAALLLLAVLSTAGCGTMRARSKAGLELANPPEPPVVVRLTKDGIADRRFHNRNGAPVIPVIQENGKSRMEITLEGEPGYDFDITYVTHIPTSKMKQYVDNPGADEKAIRNAFAEKYERALQLLELNCEVTPRCEATVDLGDSQDPRGSRKVIDAWLMPLDEREATSFHVLVRKSGNAANSWGPLEFNSRFIGFVKVARENKSLLPDLVVPLDSIGIASWRYLNPRNPAFVYEQSPTPALGGAVEATGSSSSEGQALTFDRDRDTFETLRERIRSTPIDATRKSETPDGAQGLVGALESRIIDILACKLFAAKDSKKLDDILINAAKIAKEAKSLASSQVPIIGLQLTSLEAAKKIVDQMPPKNYQTTPCAASPPSAPGLQIAAKALEILRASVATSTPDQNITDRMNQIKTIYEDAFAQLDTLATSSTPEPVQDVAATVIAESAIRRMGEISAQIQAAESATRLQQRRIRFDNITADRLFIVTFNLERCPEDSSAPPNTGASKVISFTPKEGSGCTGTISVSPGSFVDIDASIVDLAPRKILQFTVDFFDQTDDPANSTGYISLTKIDPKDPKSEPEDSHQFGIVAGLTGKSEPFIRKDQRVFFRGRQQDHLHGFARLEGSFLYGNRANAKLNLSYKNGDLGGPAEEADKIDASQYQINTYGTNALILTFGKFQFAGPSEKIAVSESGQGFRLGYKALSLSYILNRESAENIPNPRDEDKDSWILQLRPIPINWGILRSANLTAVRGQERLNRPKAGETPAVFPYVYETYGFDLFFTEPLSTRERNRDFALAGSLAGYYSERDSKVTPGELTDGRGYVALGTVSVPFNFITDDSDKLMLKKKPKYVATFLAGYGSGDDPGTSTDEGYIGETGGFSRDMIFLTSFAGASTRIRKSLSNKQYAALQITDNTTSVQSWIAKAMHINERDIVSESTTLRLSDYRFNEPIRGDRDAGQEINLEFLMEAPKSVKWTISAAYFKPGRALDRFVRDDAWSVGMGVTINPSINVFR